MYNNPSIYEIKEFFDISSNINIKYDDDDDNDGDDNNNNNNNNNNNKLSKANNHNSYIISQKSKFLISKELQIYAYSEMSVESYENEKEKTNTKTDKISIILYSYDTSLDTIQRYVHRITCNYIDNIEKSRNSKKFIYTLYKTKYDDNKYECWSEHPFESSRTFDNMFFDQKQEIIDHITFWLNNKAWYYEMGIPYTLGLGLKGPPGTGKTSFMKALANLLGRHLIILSIKLITPFLILNA